MADASKAANRTLEETRRPEEGPYSIESLGSLVENRQMVAEMESSLELAASGRAWEEVRQQALKLGAQSSGLAQALMAGVVALGISYKDASAQSPESGAQLTQEQIQIVERVTAMKFPELKTKFSVEVPVRSKSGAYILHIGQMHRSTLDDGLTNAIYQKGIVESQQDIEIVLKSIASSKDPLCVFEEGFTGYDDDEKLKALVDRIQAAMTQALAEPVTNMDSFEKSKRTFDVYRDFAKKNSIGRHFAIRQLAALKERLVSVVRDKSMVFSDNPATRETEMQKLQEYGYSLELINNNGILESEDPNPYFLGATIKMFLEGNLAQICPAESTDANVRMENAARGMKAIKDEMFGRTRYKIWAGANERRYMELLGGSLQMGRGPLSPEEHEEYKRLRTERDTLIDHIGEDIERLTDGEYREQLEKATTEYNRLAMEGREAALIENIAQYDQQTLAQGQPLGNIVVVYGAAHDFYKQLTRWNIENPQEYQRGLIKIVPQAALDYRRRTEKTK